MFVFGTQYLRGASPERDQWDRDLYRIRESGFNTVRAWLVWNAIERKEGELDYEYLSTFLETAAKNDLEVGLLFHLHACPEWAVKKYSKYFYEDSQQIPFQPAVRPNTPGGGWPGLCYDHGEVRELERRFIEGVIKETKKHDCVSFYEPMNEPHQWVELKQTPVGIFCYCDASVARFREWLREKYGDIKTLNEAWGHFYNDFDEVRPPRWTSSYADYADFRLFNMDNVKREIQYRSEIIRANDCKPVIAHAWGGGAVTCPKLGSMAFDDWKNAEVFDKWGYSAFPQNAIDCAALGLGCDATRGAAGGKDYWQSELTAGLRGVGLDVKGRVDTNTFTKFCLESIRHGAKGLLFWQYRKERFGQEWGGFALTDYDGGPTNLSLRAGEICRAVCANEDYFCKGKQKDAEVAMVFSIRSYLAAWSSNDRKDNKFAVDSISGYYKMLWEENIPVDIIHEDFPVDLSRYKLIILPSPYAISPAFSNRLREYVRAGGTILSDPFYGAFEGDFKLSYQVPGHGFDEIFGCRELDMTQRESVRVKIGQEVYNLHGTKQFELFRDVQGEILYETDEGEPILLSHVYGKGRALLAATNLGLSYSSRALIGDDFVSTDSANGSKIAKKIILDLVQEIGVVTNPCSAKGVRVSVLQAADGKSSLAILLNFCGERVEGNVAMEQPCSSCRTVLGETVCRGETDGFSFVLEANASAIVVLNQDDKI